MARTQHIKLMMQDASEEAPLRPAFQKDVEEQPLYEAAPARFMDDPPEEEPDEGPMDWDIYPDMVYQAPRRNRRAPAPDHGGGEKGPPPEPVIKDDFPPPHRSLWTPVAVVCFLLLMLLCWNVIRWRQDYAPFRQKADILARDTIAQGVLVDGVHVGGMTRAQAQQALARDFEESAGKLHMTVQVDGQTWIITPKELPFMRNTKAVLDTAFAIGRQGSVETIASRTTPFEYRYQHVYHTVSTPVSLYTQVTYDTATVRSLVGIIEANLNREAVDAQVATFDFANRAFTFTQDRAGARVDGDDLYNKIVEALNRKEFNAVITASTQPITPRVTKAELMNSFSLISSYTTETTSNANRNTNIDLAARAISGKVVMPGETFSFNQATGQRTAEKGYKMAAAIAGGTTVDEIGGGVCQVSSTLFNAAAMADMTILTRHPHTWPSNYVEKGRDATVNWPNLDFSFRNDRTSPLFIVAWYQQRKCTVELYGASLGAGQSIDLATKVLYAMEPPDEPLYEQNPNLEPGTVQEKKKARTGYMVETYKVRKKNGKEVRRELLCTSNYQMIQQVLEYN